MSAGVLQEFWRLVAGCWLLVSGTASSKGPDSDIGNPVFGIRLKHKDSTILLFELSVAVC